MERLIDNPLILLIFMFLFVVCLALPLFIVAVVSIARSVTLTSERKALWVLLCFALPLVGPAVWLLVGRGSKSPAPVGVR